MRKILIFGAVCCAGAFTASASGVQWGTDVAGMYALFSIVIGVVAGELA